MGRKRQAKSAGSPRRPKQSKESSLGRQFTGMRSAPGLKAGTVFVFSVAILVGLVEKLQPGLYLRIVQEDDVIEWATVWAFLGAALIFVFVTRDRWRMDRKLPWFAAGLSVFCFLFAMEEISWGQRLLGYRPPVYFLENNFQQEFNFHNVLGTSLRKAALQGILLGYGILLPLVGLSSSLRRRLEGLGLLIPAAATVPAFALATALYVWYPWDFSGEVTELLMGLGFLFTALFHYLELRETGGKLAGPLAQNPWVIAGLVAMGLGFANSTISSAQRSANPEMVRAAASEVEALKRDFIALNRRRGGRPVTKCGLHKRLYSYVEKYGRDELYSGTFSSLQAQGLPEDRALYFLDPWNSPFWIRHQCSKKDGRIRVFLYSFGPNRRRDATRWEVLGDDVGAIVFEMPPREPPP